MRLTAADVMLLRQHWRAWAAGADIIVPGCTGIGTKSFALEPSYSRPAGIVARP